MFGAHVALNKKFDLFGVFACALLTAVGGGTLRELLLGRVPFYFFNNMYVLAIIAGVTFSVVTYRYFGKIEKTMLIIDAVGLSTFALIGASAAGKAHLGLFAIVLLAVITAAGGGIMRDVAIREVPVVFRKELYATPAVILGLLFGLFAGLQDNGLFILVILAAAFSVRLASILWRIELWHPWAGQPGGPALARED